MHNTRLYASSSSYSTDSVEKTVYFSAVYRIRFRLVRFKYIKKYF